MTDHLVIDVDGHVFEPDELWERYLPARFHEARPKLVLDDRGTTRYLLEGRMIPPGTGRGAWVPEGMRESTVHREGGVDPKLRLEDMDIEGIDITVLYGAVSLGFYRMQDRELSIACCRAYNNWLHDYCQTNPDRMKGTPALPLEWIDDACAEAERSVKELGFVSLTVPSRNGDRNPDDPANFPLYELAESLDVPIGIHAGGCRFGHDMFVDSYAQLHAIEFPFNGMFAATTLVCGGVFERFRSLRIALLESGTGWVPFLFERLDEHFEYRPQEMPNITRPPSEYLGEGRLFISTEGERGLPQIIEQAGSDWLVWASDYPHWDTEFPNSVTRVERRDDLDAAAKRQLFESNPQRLLGWA
jgi:uncharacterized protein